MASNETVIQLKTDLDRKWRLHGDKCCAIWATLNKKQREKCVKDGAMEGAVLKSRRDRTLGNVNKIMPEWNLEDLTAPKSDFLIRLLKHRAEHSLAEQYCEGVDGGLGDFHIIIENNVRHSNARALKDCYTLFVDGPNYGAAYRIADERARDAFTKAIEAQVCIPQEVGDLVLIRQMYMLQVMNIIIEDILDAGADENDKTPIPAAASFKDKKKKGTNSTDPSTITGANSTSTHGSLAIRPAPMPKRTLDDLLPLVQDQTDSVKQYLEIMMSSPPLLSHAVNGRFFSQPGLLPDEKGRRLGVHTDNFISPVLLETVYEEVKAAAVWNYINRLMGLLKEHESDKLYRIILLQEISNVCHFEFARAQAAFKRAVHAHIGTKHFKRIGNSTDALGNHKAAIKGKPDALLATDAQLCYVLRLCLPQTTASSAVQLLSALENIHEKDEAWERLSEEEARTLGDLSAIVGLLQDMLPAISLPPLSRKKGQMFVERSTDLEKEVAAIKPGIDLSDYVIPIDNLSNPESAEGALTGLAEYINAKLGVALDFLFQDLIDDCLAELTRQHAALLAATPAAPEAASETVPEKKPAEAAAKKAKGKTKQAAPAMAEWIPLPVPPQDEPAVRFEKRREKQKTRPAHSSIYVVVESQVDTDKVAAEKKKKSAKTAAPRISVNRETLELFERLFAKKDARGSVDWALFEKAMTHLGFTVTPRFGSVIKFLPVSGGRAAVGRAITFHRPHHSKIEGFRVLYYARRLNSVYGWDEDTFVLKE